jgi:threonine dehydratase
MTFLDFNDILQARKHLHGIIRETPFEKSGVLSDRTGMAVYLKAECLQRTGSFKLRGAYHKIASLGSQEKAKGIVTSSAGNHAQGVGFERLASAFPAAFMCPKPYPTINW